MKKKPNKTIAPHRNNDSVPSPHKDTAQHEDTARHKSLRQSSAIGLHYDGDSAPIVSVAGIGPIAEKIIASAIQNDVPIYENADLLESLAQLNIGQEIPEELYLIIAQIIAFVYHLKGITPETRNQ